MAEVMRDHAGLEILTPAQCLHLLRVAPFGRLAFSNADGIQVFPVNHVMHGFTIAFRTAPGSKLDAARDTSDAAFEVDGVDSDRRTGWSVVAIGAVRLAEDVDRAQLAQLELEPWADNVARDNWLVVEPERLTGRRIARPSSSLDDPGPANLTHGARLRENGGLLGIVCNCGWHGKPVEPGDRAAIGAAHDEYRAHVVTTDLGTDAILSQG